MNWRPLDTTPVTPRGGPAGSPLPCGGTAPLPFRNRQVSGPTEPPPGLPRGVRPLPAQRLAGGADPLRHLGSLHPGRDERQRGLLLGLREAPPVSPLGLRHDRGGLRPGRSCGFLSWRCLRVLFSLVAVHGASSRRRLSAAETPESGFCHCELIQVDQIVETCRHARKNGIAVAMSLIVDHPEETWRDPRCSRGDRLQLRRGYLGGAGRPPGRPGASRQRAHRKGRIPSHARIMSFQ